MERSRQKNPLQPSRFQQQDAWVSDLDPVLQGGYKLAFIQPKFSLQLRSFDQKGEQVSTRQLLQLRLLTLRAQGTQQIKIELSSQQDLFKLYLCHIDAAKFTKISASQHLNFPFSSLQNMLIKQIQLCQRQPNQFSAVLHLHFIENIEYKRIQLLSVEFEDMKEEELKNYVTYRFTKSKVNRQIIQKKLWDVMGIAKLKNQNLWSEIVKKEQNKKNK